jgi:hypothetical protein
MCTKCTCKATNKQGFYHLSHSDSERKNNWKSTKAEGNLTNIEDNPSIAILLGSPVLTTTEADGAPNNEVEITFNSAWFPLVVPVDNGDGGTSPVAYCCPTAAVLMSAAPLIAGDANDDEFLGLPVLRSRCNGDSSGDEDDDECVPKNIWRRQKRKAPFHVKTLMLEAEG